MLTRPATNQPPKAVVVGAGPAGLAAAACLKAQGLTPVILDRADTIASAWHSHYDCLHLHTARGRSTLPGLSYPSGTPKYPRRRDVITYMQAYATHHGLTPRLGCTVNRVEKTGSGWQVAHTSGTELADIVVIATGVNGTPRQPDWPGQFSGPIQHSSAYRTPTAFSGQKVLVVGFGNSGGDIALDLARAGIDVTMSVRGPVNILPKQLFGIPITSFGLLTRLLGYKLADALTAPVLRIAVGRPEAYGLRSMDKGPAALVHEDDRIPLIDTGTLAEIKAGRIAVKPGIDRLDGAQVQFTDGTNSPFDAIIAAIGYSVDLRPLLGDDCPALDATGRPLISGAPTPAPGLYFCSFKVSPDGQLYATAREAIAIAQHARTLPGKVLT